MIDLSYNTGNDFVEYSKMVLGVLGYKIFVPLIKQDTYTEDEKIKQDQEELLLYLARKSKKSNNKTIEAKCMRTNEGFVVLKDSMIEEMDSNAIPKSIKELRAKCKKNHEIVEGKIIKNYFFNSPSYASAFILEMNTNGRTDWKTKDGITLKRIEESEIKD